MTTSNLLIALALITIRFVLHHFSRFDNISLIETPYRETNDAIKNGCFFQKLSIDNKNTTTRGKLFFNHIQNNNVLFRKNQPLIKRDSLNAKNIKNKVRKNKEQYN